ncbi:UvrD-helicase domain-containing protein [Paenactinomyces guangxiensis]|uniref:ATP-dependent helicase n=1 Tax=Paenactinomyces guangxiensis TaxID=1490290 RepID=A0A7W1WV54_9BACL|nr:ATP-dependent helicase [Paenactinomyces guangxiensis]MBA4496421.1 ATP-dependent helicase [Paenactinomyces guangxiensis]MBH8593522.1 ATP-dependent helicase [Paenactinomyces guangxiensis]
MYEPTPEQTKILCCDSNCVVAAGPGSGKTSTISHKINLALNDLRWFQGVIAISYTNKASNELKRKTERICHDLKNSFFGTIDSFYISNIIIPFGKRFFGIPNQHITIEKFENVDKDYIEEIKYLLEQILDRYKGVTIEDLEKNNIKPIEQILSRDFEFIARNFIQGRFDLRLVGHIANLIFLSSKSCRRYFKARYKYLFIDEFQDSGLEQYYLFLRISEIGIVSWAIGDVNQSIYRFAEKSSKYLAKLMQIKQFEYLPMTKNHRCHPSIDYYSKKLLNPDMKNNEHVVKDIRVFEAYIEGNEKDIGSWLDNELEKIKQSFNVLSNSKIGVLARYDRTLNFFVEGLRTPYKLHVKTNLDDDQSFLGALFRKLLAFAFDHNKTAYSFIDEYFDRESPKDQFKINRVKELLASLRGHCDAFLNKKGNLLESITEIFSDIALIIYPNINSSRSISNLKLVLADEKQLMVYKPAEPNQIQLMTLHKSKGLEFDIVIHVDLYQYVIPGYNWIVYEDREEFIDSMNLHYVGITRAREAVIFAISSERYHSSSKEFRRAERSELLDGDIENYRLEWS